jgi:hypothetical protein
LIPMSSMVNPCNTAMSSQCRLQQRCSAMEIGKQPLNPCLLFIFHLVFVLLAVLLCICFDRLGFG